MLNRLKSIIHNAILLLLNNIILMTKFYGFILNFKVERDDELSEQRVCLCGFNSTGTFSNIALHQTLTLHVRGLQGYAQCGF